MPRTIVSRRWLIQCHKPNSYLFDKMLLKCDYNPIQNYNNDQVRRFIKKNWPGRTPDVFRIFTWDYIYPPYFIQKGGKKKLVRAWPSTIWQGVVR